MAYNAGQRLKIGLHLEERLRLVRGVDSIDSGGGLQRDMLWRLPHSRSTLCNLPSRRNFTRISSACGTKSCSVICFGMKIVMKGVVMCAQVARIQR